MTQVSFLQPEMDAKYVYSALTSGRLAGVRDFLARKPDSEMEAICQTVFVELGYKFAIKGLDIVTKKKLRGLQQTFNDFIVELRHFRKEDERIQSMAEGYPKYQATCVLLGRDPVSYHEWTDIQVDLSHSFGR